MKIKQRCFVLLPAESAALLGKWVKRIHRDRHPAVCKTMGVGKSGGCVAYACRMHIRFGQHIHNTCIKRYLQFVNEHYTRRVARNNFHRRVGLTRTQPLLCMAHRQCKSAHIEVCERSDTAITGPARLRPQKKFFASESRCVGEMVDTEPFSSSGPSMPIRPGKPGILLMGGKLPAGIFAAILRGSNLDGSKLVGSALGKAGNLDARSFSGFSGTCCCCAMAPSDTNNTNRP